MECASIADTGQGTLLNPWYDPMLAKVIVKGKNREDARNQMIKALKEVRITGLSSNRDFLVGIAQVGLFQRKPNSYRSS